MEAADGGAAEPLRLAGEAPEGGVDVGVRQRPHDAAVPGREWIWRGGAVIRWGDVRCLRDDFIGERDGWWTCVVAVPGATATGVAHSVG